MTRSSRSSAIPRGADLGELGVELVAGDLATSTRSPTSSPVPTPCMHLAGTYRVGIQVAERPAMLDANLGTTTRVLDAAARAGTPRIVYVSTVNVLGNTHGRVVDETHRRDLAEGFLS